MLIFNRKTGERIVIRDDIIVQVVSIGTKQTRLGVLAPGNVRIRRAKSDTSQHREIGLHRK